MNYFKILKWGGGEGGDALLACALLSNKHIKSNVLINTLKLTLQGRTDMQVNENLQNYPSILKMALHPDVSRIDVSEESHMLKYSGENYLLKSHMSHTLMPDTITIYLTAKTLPFYFAARFSKLSRYFALHEPKMFMQYKKDKQSVIKSCVEGYKETLEKNLHFKQEITTEDLLYKRYDKMQNVLELNFNNEGINFFETWVEKQKELYWDELRILFE